MATTYKSKLRVLAECIALSSSLFVLFCNIKGSIKKFLEPESDSD